MKKQLLLVAACSLVTLFLFVGCIKDTVTRTYTYTLYQPVYKTTEDVRANIRSNAPETVQQPGKLFIQGNYIFLNEVDKGVHIIDNSDPAHPKNVAFIDIPGNVDLAVKGTTLYADLYTDLVAIDIDKPLEAEVTQVVENVFPHRAYSNGFGYYNIDSTMVIADWIVKDTTVTDELPATAWRKTNRGGVIMFEDNMGRFALANSTAKSTTPSQAGRSGSMARFTIVGSRLYTVGFNELTVFAITDAAKPVYIGKQQIGFGIETIYPFKDKLFVGSTNGMFIYNISNPDQPQQVSQFTHVQSCDPVIAEDNYAYVTLRSGTTCNGFTNQMEVLYISNLMKPVLVRTYPMTHPMGLSKDGDLLFVCDDSDGLKVYNAAKPDALRLLKTISGFATYDVIAYNGLAIVVAQDGLYQFDYTNPENIRQLSKLSLN